MGYAQVLLVLGMLTISTCVALVAREEGESRKVVADGKAGSGSEM
jgi:hypothetical protein